MKGKPVYANVIYSSNPLPEKNTWAIYAKKHKAVIAKDVIPNRANTLVKTILFSTTIKKIGNKMKLNVINCDWSSTGPVISLDKFGVIRKLTNKASMYINTQVTFRVFIL